MGNCDREHASESLPWLSDKSGRVESNSRIRLTNLPPRKLTVGWNFVPERVAIIQKVVGRCIIDHSIIHWQEHWCRTASRYLSSRGGVIY